MGLLTLINRMSSNQSAQPLKLSETQPRIAPAKFSELPPIYENTTSQQVQQCQWIEYFRNFFQVGRQWKQLPQMNASPLIFIMNMINFEQFKLLLSSCKCYALTIICA